MAKFRDNCRICVVVFDPHFEEDTDAFHVSVLGLPCCRGDACHASLQRCAPTTMIFLPAGRVFNNIFFYAIVFFFVSYDMIVKAGMPDGVCAKMHLTKAGGDCGFKSADKGRNRFGRSVSNACGCFLNSPGIITFSA